MRCGGWWGRTLILGMEFLVGDVGVGPDDVAQGGEGEVDLGGLFQSVARCPRLALPFAAPSTPCGNDLSARCA